MDDIVPILQNAFHQQKFATSNQQAVAVIEGWCDDDVGDACLIFHRKKDKALSGTWPLPSNHATSHVHEFPIFAPSQLLGRQNSLLAEFSPAIRHWVFADRKTSACVIGDQALLGSHLGERV